MESPQYKTNFTTDRPVAVLMVFLAAVVFGYFSFRQLPMTLMPEMSYPTLTVRTEYPGAAPEEVENDVSRPIEEALGVVNGLNEISSISRAGVSDVVLEFVWGTPMADAIQNTLEKLDLVYLPREAEKPLLLHYDPSLDPVMELSLSGSGQRYRGDEGQRRLRRIAELQVKRAIEPITGVAAARVRGGLEEEIHVLIDEAKLQRVNLSINDVIRRLRAENINAAGGRISEGGAEYMIRTINEYQRLDEIADTIVFRRDGREIRVKDLGQVVHGQRDREMLTHTNGEVSVQIDIYKEADANMVNVAGRVRALVGEPTFKDKPKTPDESAAARSGPGRRSGRSAAAQREQFLSMFRGPTLSAKLNSEEQAKLRVVADRSIFINNSISEVKQTAYYGGMLAIIVLLLFLRDLRTTAIIAVSIPISILVTFAPLNILDVSLNIMSLGGLAMGIGMLVDSSIVVLESIYRCREEGDSTRDAAIRGTTEVRGAVIASTLTSICVFFPMVFVEGLAGQVFSDLGLTVVTSLIAALIVAVLFIPMLASRTGFQLKAGAGMVDHALGSICGRLSLSDFWLRFFLPLGLLLLVMIGVDFLYADWALENNDDPGGPSEVDHWAEAVAVFTMWRAFCTIPFIIALIHRVHDRGRSAWWLFALFPIFEALFLPGQSGDNRFGAAGSGQLRLAKLWGSFRSFGESRQRNARLFLIASPYFALRLAVALLLELIGLTVYWYIRAVAAVAYGVYWVIRKIGAALGQALSRLGRDHAAGEAVDTANGLYPRLIRWALASPTAMLALIIGCFGLTWWVGKQLETELLPEVHQSEFTFEASLPVGTPLEETVKLLSGVEQKILDSMEDGESKIDALLVMYGFDTTNMKRSDEGEHSGKFKVLLKPTDNPKRTEQEVIARLRDLFAGVPDVTTRVTRPVLFSSKKPVVIQIEGDDLPELKQYSDEATALLSKKPELADVEPSLRSGAPEVQITYDRQQIIRHGLNLNTVAEQVRDMVKGSEATRFNRRDRRVPVVVRLAEKDREQVADVGKLTINPGGDTPIPLNSIANLTVGEGPSEIRRIDGKRVALVQANIGAGSLGTAVGAAKRTLDDGLDLPIYMDFYITGQNREWERSRTSLYLALGLSLFLVYVIMASQFESLVQPFIIMFTIPMAFVGTVLGLKWLGLNLSVVVFLGMIMLAGIVVNNAIVLVDYANRLRGRGLALREAIIRAGCVRLRPILMTTATTVLGLLPMALGLGDGAEIRTPMAVAVICGLLTSTVLTLLVIPTIYYLFGLAGERFFQPREE
jgi:multidrug efflux pump subunit AcrB